MIEWTCLDCGDPLSDEEAENDILCCDCRTRY